MVTYLAIDPPCLCTVTSLGYDFCPVCCLESSLQLCREMMPYQRPGMLTSSHAHALFCQGIFIVYLALVCGLIHVFLCCAVTTGSEIWRFSFQARMSIRHVTLKPHNEKSTFQNKETRLNVAGDFLLKTEKKRKNSH